MKPAIQSALIIIAMSIWPAAFPATKNMNVLFIAIDDLNDWIGAMGGHPNANTPNIDRLAKRGMLFTNAHTASPVCNSSRAAIMTGLRPSTTGIYRNGVSSRKTVGQNPTISEMFKNQGYYTAGAGKILHGFYFKSGAWHEFKGKPQDPKAKPADIYSIGDQFKAHPLDNNLENETMDAQTVSWVVDQLKKNHRKPFFIAAGIYRPHVPWRVPKRFFQQLPADSLAKPPFKENDLNDVGSIAFELAMRRSGKATIPTDINKGSHALIRNAGHWGLGMQTYLASIMHADTQVGRLLDTLDKSEYADNTAIVLWSDHGWHLGEKHHWRKSTLWEESTRVPLIISVPGMTKAGSHSNEAVSLLDIYPTLADITGLTAPKKIEGESLMPLLIDPHAKKATPAVIEYRRGNVAVRGDRFRYIKYVNGDEELYDHKNDPNEWKNLASESKYKKEIKELSKWIPKKFAVEPN